MSTTFEEIYNIDVETGPKVDVAFNPFPSRNTVTHYHAESGVLGGGYEWWVRPGGKAFLVNTKRRQARPTLLAVEENTPEVADPTEDLVRATLADQAERLPALAADLLDPALGHKALAARWSHLTTESSVRRWRTKHEVVLAK